MERRIARFALASLIAAGTSAIVFPILYVLTNNTTLCSIVAFAAGAVPNWTLNRKWTWKVEGRVAFGREIVAYVIVSASTLVLLSLPWWFAWSTTDLVWSLWLSSFVVGYAIIVWGASEPLRAALVDARLDDSGQVSAAQKMAALVFFAGAMLVIVAFFTVHFGLFHLVHSVFLNTFFPIAPQTRGWPGAAVYLEVLRRYWWFLPAAFLAERHAFHRAPLDRVTGVALTRESLRERLAPPDDFGAPYRNVMRMHFLIFFFAFAHFAKLENFTVYALVYALYFFPWRLLRRPPPAD